VKLSSLQNTIKIAPVHQFPQTNTVAKSGLVTTKKFGHLVQTFLEYALGVLTNKLMSSLLYIDKENKILYLNQSLFRSSRSSHSLLLDSSSCNLTTKLPTALTSFIHHRISSGCANICRHNSIKLNYSSSP
jgi:hypothetical protein